MVYLLALAAALASAIGGVLQRIGIQTAPAEDAMRLRLLTNAFRHRVWLAGFGFLLITFVLQAMALRFGDLAVVQPTLTVELLFLIAILAVVFHYPIGWRDFVGGFGIVAGLAAFLAIAAPVQVRGIPGSRAWWTVSAIVLSAFVILAGAGLRGPRWWRAVAFGASAAMLFAYTSSFLKATTTLITGGWGHVFTHWEPYALLVSGGLGFFMLQNALHAGPIAASRSVMVIINPLVSIAIGVFVFGENLRSGTWFVLGEVIALAVMCAGAVTLAQSPLVTGDTGHGEPGEMLELRARAPAPR